jgi:hypothetical protein
MVPLMSASATTESFSVYTDKQYYNVGDIVNIYAQANSINPNNTITVTNVVVYDPNNSTIAEWNNLSIVLDNTTTIVLIGALNVTTEGTYTVNATATGCIWRLWCRCYFFCECKPPKPIPEYPFGTMAAMTALFGAMGLYFARKKYKIKK